MTSLPATDNSRPARIARGLAVSVLAVLILFVIDAEAQPGTGISVAYDFFPFSRLSSPDTTPVDGQRNFEQDLEVRVSALYMDLVIPASFSDKTQLYSRISYHRLDIDYTGWNQAQGGNPVENAQAIEVSASLDRKLSYQWNGILSITPGMYSDFENDIAFDDFNLSVFAQLIRNHSDNLSYGFGFAYTFDYGEPLPLPILSAAWTNGRNLSVHALLPAFVEFWYNANPTIDLGFMAKVSGQRYHGSPARYKLANPQVQYSVATVGPSLQFHLGSKLMLRGDTGITFRRRFETANGGTDIGSVDLKQSYYFKVMLSVGT